MIGATTSQSLDLTLLNKGDMVYGTSAIKVEIGLKTGSTIEYIPMGIYNIDDIEKTDYTIKITAFDNMMKFERNFISNLGDTLTIQQVVNELVRITGVQFTGTLPTYTFKKLEGFSCREVLSYVASICGGNAVITRDGKFTIVTPKDINYSIGTSNYFDYKREETKYKIGKISCQVGEKVLSKGSLGADSMELEFENPWVTDSILQDIYSKLNGFEYLGYSMKWQGDLSLDVGDIVTITDKKGVVRKHPILSQKFTYTGGLTSEISAKGENKNKNEFSSSGPSTKKIERVFTELAIVNEALIGVAYIDDLTAGNIKFDTASGNIMDLQTLLAKFVTGENGQFLNLTTDNVVIANAVIKDAMIDSVNANKINTGTLDTNKVTVQGPSGNLLIKDNTIQIKDSTRVRVQIGKDASGDYSMYVWDKQGNVMFDALGLKSSAIKDKIIRDDMVSDNANINGSKLNISSLITEVNKDNTQTLKASKIAFDSTGQSLEVSFNSLKSNVDGLEIGGRNLVYNSTGNLGTKGWTNGGVSNFTAVENGGVEGNSLKLVGRSADTARKNISQVLTNKFIDLNNIKQVTLSFWYKASEDSDITGIGSFLRISNKTSQFNDVLNSTNTLILDNQWRHKTITEDLSRFNNTNITSIVLFFFTYLGTVEYCNIKLEFGSKNTGYTSAPEDTEEKIETNTTAITVAQGKIEGIIKDTSIVKGDVTTLKDKYTSIKATVDGINSTVVSHTTSITNLGTNVTNAQNTANKANSLADSKAKVFTTTPTTPYKIGDLWVQGTSGDVMRCKVARASGNYVASDWEKASKYTDDTKANSVEKNLNTLGGKVTTVETKQASLEQNLNGFKTTVSNTYTTKTEYNTLNGTVTNIQQRVNTVEQKVTATAITTTISSAINNGTSTITTTQFVMDKNGLTVKNGAIKIQNKAGTNVLSADTNGNLRLNGRLDNISGSRSVTIDNGMVYAYTNNVLNFSLGNNALSIYDYYDTAKQTLVGELVASRNSASGNLGIALLSAKDKEVSIGYRESTTSFSYLMRFNKNMNYGVQYPINVLESMYLADNIALGFGRNSEIGGTSYLQGYNGVLSLRLPVNKNGKGFWIENSYTAQTYMSFTEGATYRAWIEPSCYVNGNLFANGNIACSGAKTRVVETESYSKLRLNAYETADCLFADYGSGVIGEDGTCFIALDDKLLETINTKRNYQIFLTAIDKEDKFEDIKLKIIRKESNYFVVKGNIGLEFDWNIVAKQLGYENERLVDHDRTVLMETEDTLKFNLLSNQESKDNVKGIEKLLTEKVVTTEDLLLNEVI